MEKGRYRGSIRHEPTLKPQDKRIKREAVVDPLNLNSEPKFIRITFDDLNVAKNPKPDGQS